MANRKWVNINLGKLVPEELPDAVGFVNDNVVTPFATLLEELIRLLELAKLGLLFYTDPIIAALTVAIDEIDEIIEKFRTAIGVHALFVPVLPVGEEVPIYEQEESWVFWEDPPDPDTGDYFSLDPAAVPLFQFNPPVSEGSGGNWGFFAEYAASLDDEGDDARPVYKDDHFVMALTLIFGAKSLGALITAAFRLFKLLKKLTPFPMDRYILPVPQNLRVETVTPFPAETAALVSAATNAEDIEGSDTAVILTWDFPDIIDIRDFFPDTQVTIVSRSLYSRLDTPFPDTVSGEVLELHEIQRDDDVPSLNVKTVISGLDPDKEYYFSVGYNVELVETVPVYVTRSDGKIITDNNDQPIPELDENGEAITEETTTLLEHYDTSNSVRVKLSELGNVTSGLPQSELPNWVGLKGPAVLLPPVEEALTGLQDLLRTLRDSLLATIVDDFTDFIDDMKEYSQFYLERVQALEEVLTLLEELLRALDLEIYAYGFSGKGGTNLLRSEMNSALFDPATVNRPPFEGGGDFVAGLVLVGGAPISSPIDGLVTFLKLIFGDVFTKIKSMTPVEEASGIEEETDLSEAIDTIERLAGEATTALEDLEAMTGLEPAEPETTRFDEEDIGEVDEAEEEEDQSTFEAVGIGVDEGCSGGT